MRGLNVQVRSTNIGMPGGNAHEGVCITVGVAAMGGCEWTNENGAHSRAGYVVGVDAE
jgi:hypothetical protein